MLWSQQLLLIPVELPTGYLYPSAKQGRELLAAAASLLMKREGKEKKIILEQQQERGSAPGLWARGTVDPGLLHAVI